MNNYSAKTVEEYIESAPENVRLKLEEARMAAKSAFPKAEERIWYGVPFYFYHGPLIGFSAYKNHISFGLANALTAIDREALESKGYKTGSKTFQIKPNQEVPTNILVQMLNNQARINETQKP